MLPDIQLMLSEEVVVFDNLKESVFIITHINPETSQTHIKQGKHDY
jgi:anthranilate synthase component 1